MKDVENNKKIKALSNEMENELTVSHMTIKFPLPIMVAILA